MRRCVRPRGLGLRLPVDRDAEPGQDPPVPAGLRRAGAGELTRARRENHPGRGECGDEFMQLRHVSTLGARFCGRVGLVNSVATFLVGVAIFVGILGIVIPILPGALLSLAAILVWALEEQSRPADRAGRRGRPDRCWVRWSSTSYRSGDCGNPGATASTVVGVLLGIVGFFVIPVVGMFVGFLLGVYLSERQRLGAHGDAWTSTKHALRATGLSILIEVIGVARRGRLADRRSVPGLVTSATRLPGFSYPHWSFVQGWQGSVGWTSARCSVWHAVRKALQHGVVPEAHREPLAAGRHGGSGGGHHRGWRSGVGIVQRSTRPRRPQPHRPPFHHTGPTASPARAGPVTASSASAARCTASS